MNNKKDFQDMKDKLREMLRLSGHVRQKDTMTKTSSTGAIDDDITQIDLELNLTETMDDRISQIQDALKRIDDGSYGICLDCGKEIIPERLEAIPEAMFCIDCQKKKERQAESMTNLRDTFFPDQIS